jgi:hypothetical protein
MIRDALERHAQGVTAAARELGVNKSNLYDHMVRAGIPTKRSQRRAQCVRLMSPEFRRFLGMRSSICR